MSMSESVDHTIQCRTNVGRCSRTLGVYRAPTWLPLPSDPRSFTLTRSGVMRDCTVSGSSPEGGPGSNAASASSCWGETLVRLRLPSREGRCRVSSRCCSWTLLCKDEAGPSRGTTPHGPRPPWTRRPDARVQEDRFKSCVKSCVAKGPSVAMDCIYNRHYFPGHYFLV
jgi:hypothetical protein